MEDEPVRSTLLQSTRLELGPTTCELRACWYEIHFARAASVSAPDLLSEDQAPIRILPVYSDPGLDVGGTWLGDLPEGETVELQALIKQGDPVSLPSMLFRREEWMAGLPPTGSSLMGPPTFRITRSFHQIADMPLDGITAGFDRTKCERRVSVRASSIRVGTLRYDYP